MLVLSTAACLLSTAWAFSMYAPTTTKSAYQLNWRTIVKDNKPIGELRHLERECLRTIRNNVVSSWQAYPQFKDPIRPSSSTNNNNNNEFVRFKAFSGPKHTKIYQEVLGVKVDKKGGKELYEIRATIVDKKRREAGRVQITLTATHVTGVNPAEHVVELTVSFDQFDIISSQQAASKSPTELSTWDAKLNQPTVQAVHLLHKVEKFMQSNVARLIKKAHSSKDSKAIKTNFILNAVKARMALVIKEVKAPGHFVYEAAVGVTSPRGLIMLAVWQSHVNKLGDDQFDYSHIKFLPEYLIALPPKKADAQEKKTDGGAENAGGNEDEAGDDDEDGEGEDEDDDEDGEDGEEDEESKVQ